MGNNDAQLRVKQAFLDGFMSKLGQEAAGAWGPPPGCKVTDETLGLLKRYRKEDLLPTELLKGSRRVALDGSTVNTATGKPYTALPRNEMAVGGVLGDRTEATREAIAGL